MMEIPWPRCGNRTPHEPHPGQLLGQADCFGWTAEQEMARSLMDALEALVKLAISPEQLPESVRVIMSPHAMVTFQRAITYGPQADSTITHLFSIPVVVENYAHGWAIEFAHGEVPS